MRSPRAPGPLRNLVFTLVLFAFALVLIELSLRAIASFAQKSPPLTDATDGRKVILALGESTTQLGGDESYPSFLQRALDRRSPGQYAVYNGGLAGASTSEIVESFRSFCEFRRPDIVILMMGINDHWALKKAGSFAKSLTNVESHIGQIRILKLLNLVAINLKFDPFFQADSTENILTDFFDRSFLSKPPKNHLSAPDEESLLLAEQLVIPDPIQADQIFNRLSQSGLVLPFRDYFIWAHISFISGNFGAAEQVLKYALKFYNEPEDFANVIYELIHWNQRSGSILMVVKPLIEMALEREPNNRKVLALLIHALILDGSLESIARAEALLDAQLSVPTDDLSNIFLRQKAGLEMRRHSYESAEQHLNQSLSLPPNLATGFILQDYYEVLRINGKRDLSDKVAELRGAQLRYWENQQTLANYNQAIQIASKIHAEILIVPYPNMPSQQLHAKFNGIKYVRVLQNQDKFKAVQEQHGVDKMFLDRFAFYFGHFSATGAKAWAEIIADEILANSK